MATLLGTACGAPYLVAAFGWALTQPASVVLVVFTAAGVGMSLPYAILSANPVWLKFLPKPGGWMVTFKQLMGFLLIGTTVWLLSVLGEQLGESGIVWTVAFLGFLGMSAWIIGRIQPAWTARGKVSASLVALVVAIGGGWFSYGVMYEPPGSSKSATVALGSSGPSADPAPAKLDWSEGIPWQAYRPGLAEELAAQGYTVFVDYTAAWCLTCQTNKKLVLETEAVRRRMQELGVVPLKADLTKPDPALSEELKRFGRPSVPLNVIYPAERPNEPPIVLPVLLRQSVVLEKLDLAGPSAKVTPIVSRAGRAEGR